MSSLESLEPFMLHRLPATPTLTQTQTPTQVAVATPQKEPPPNTAAKGTLKSKARETDTLFQIFLQMVSPFQDRYELRNRVQRMQQKIEWVPLFQDKAVRATIKQRKLCKLESLETDLANDEYLSVSQFLALCFAHEVMLNVLLIFANRTCYVVRRGLHQHPLYVIREVDRRQRLYVMEAEHPNCDLLESLQSEYLLAERVDGHHGLKAISGYKLPELQALCGKLQLNSAGTKQELYERLVQHLS